MATIEKRLDYLQLYAICKEDTGLTWSDGRLVSATNQLAKERTAIIAGWNAAVEAMTAFVDYMFVVFDDGTWACGQCQNNSWGHGHDDDCLIPQFQAALARMNGLHDGDDVV